MEARIFRAALMAAVLFASMGASYRTPNFVLQTQSPELAERFAKAAEQYRRDLAIEWLGEPMPEWSQPCVVTAQVGLNLGAGGATTFVFDRGEVFGWRMTIQGSAERILDSVLPHEITHMVFACRFRRPLPRWADEGGATSVEHPTERAKHHKMLVEFLRSNRGIAFNRMFTMEQYPRDIMPLYAQGYTLCEFLMQQGGRRKFLDFLADGLEANQWSAATKGHYGFADVGTLQNAWLAWVRQGFPRIESPLDRPGNQASPELLAGGGKLPRLEPNLIYRIGKPSRGSSASEHPLPTPGPSAASTLAMPAVHVELAGVEKSRASVLPASGWHAPGETSGPAQWLGQETGHSAREPEPVHAQVAHPQPPEKARQIILEWQRR
ncbi:MAG: hypothetical protein ABIP48_06750 [Planctomycetota bacterium]